MYDTGDVIRTTSEVESLVSLCARALEGVDQITRRSLARLVGNILRSTQVEQVVQLPESSKRVKKERPGPDDDDTSISPAAAPTEVMKALLTPGEMLLQLSTQYNKPQSTRKIRVGIFDFYAETFSALGPSFAEAQYGLIVNHLMTEIISHSRYALTTNRYEKLLSRKLVDILLRDLIGIRMLSEQAQINAIQELSNTYLKRWPALMPGQTAPDAQVLTVALNEVSGLLQQLGSSPSIMQVRNPMAAVGLLY
jgi:hypothetical protein